MTAALLVLWPLWAAAAIAFVAFLLVLTVLVVPVPLSIPLPVSLSVSVLLTVSGARARSLLALFPLSPALLGLLKRKRGGNIYLWTFFSLSMLVFFFFCAVRSYAPSISLPSCRLRRPTGPSSPAPSCRPSAPRPALPHPGGDRNENFRESVKQKTNRRALVTCPCLSIFLVTVRRGRGFNKIKPS